MASLLGQRTADAGGIPFGFMGKNIVLRYLCGQRSKEEAGRMGEQTRRLRIAMVAPPWFEVPPQGYGGIEAVCAGLVDRLVARGHRVTLIGADRDGTGPTTSVTNSVT